MFVLGGCSPSLVPDEDKARPQPEQAGRDAVREDAYLARAEQCRESIAAELRNNWREVSANFSAEGTLRSARRAHFYRLSGDTPRPCSQLLREGDSASGAPLKEFARLARLIRLAAIYAEDSDVLDGASDRAGVRKDDVALVESVYAHLREVHAEWEREDRIVQFKLYNHQEQNYDALRADLDRRGATLQRAKLDMVIELRRLRRCYVEPKTELRCAEVIADLSAAHERFFNPDTVNEAAEDRSKVFWLTTFEEDARTLDTLLRRTPPTVVRLDEIEGLSFEPVVDQAVRRLLRDAETLAFDFP